jgi:hypothetical protein
MDNPSLPPTMQSILETPKVSNTARQAINEEDIIECETPMLALKKTPMIQNQNHLHRQRSLSNKIDC